ncbi:MAG: hypothetical protein HQL54_12905, partial [Magnetococcales bacterium]|nr:hypothetical protein [Magnetococcales bacterium]
NAAAAWASGATVAAIVQAAVITAATMSAARLLMPDAPSLSSGKRTQAVRQAIESQKIAYGLTRVGGQYTYLGTTSDRKIHILITLAAHEIESVEKVWFGEEEVSFDPVTGEVTGKYANFAWVYPGLGTAATDSGLHTALSTAFPDKWTADHKQTGHAKIYLVLKKSASKYPNSVPSITVLIKGRKIFDPRTGVTAWSANSALCVLDYLMDTEFGKGAVYPDDFDVDDLVASANNCDEQVTLAAGGSEARYQCHGVLDTSNRLGSNLEHLLVGMWGRLSHRIDQKWSIRSAYWRPPTLSLGLKDLHGPIRVYTLQSKRDVFNGVKGIFAHPDGQYQPTDFPAYQGAGYLAQDGGIPIWRDLEFGFTTSAAACQRIARIALEENRQQVKIEIELRISALEMSEGDCFTLTLDRYGWTDKAFVVDEWRLINKQDDEGGAYIAVALKCSEVDPDVYAWDPVGDEKLMIVSSGTPSVDYDICQPPTNLSVTSDPYVFPDQTTQPRLKAAWDSSPDSTLKHYEIRWRVNGSGDEFQISTTTAALKYVTGVEHLEEYEVQVAAMSEYDVYSAWLTDTAVAAGDTTPPSIPSSIQVTAESSGGIEVAWYNSPEHDFQSVDVLRSETDDVQTASVIATEAGTFGSYAFHLYPDHVEDVTYYFWLKARDTTGNLSDPSSSYSVTAIA